MPRRRSSRGTDFTRTVARTRRLVETVRRTADAVHRVAKEARHDAEEARRLTEAARRQSRAQIDGSPAAPQPAAEGAEGKRGPADNDPPEG